MLDTVRMLFNELTEELELFADGLRNMSSFGDARPGEGVEGEGEQVLVGDKGIPGEGIGDIGVPS